MLHSVTLLTRSYLCSERLSWTRSEPTSGFRAKTYRKDFGACHLVATNFSTPQHDQTIFEVHYLKPGKLLFCGRMKRAFGVCLPKYLTNCGFLCCVVSDWNPINDGLVQLLGLFLPPPISREDARSPCLTYHVCSGRPLTCANIVRQRCSDRV
jgi:hypothetical protein